ncbi:MAG: DUF4270 domain-containing protein [Chlorobi bacterium]|nr:DUF4270 domain-containing protein [Chlorobiota bacterium]
MTKLLVKKSKIRFNNRYNPEYFLLFLFIILLFSQCSKPAGQIGAIIQPEDSKLNLFYTDTTSIYAYSEPNDSVRTDHLVTSMVGSVSDPVFGITTAGFYMEFLLSIPDHDFGEDPQLDSLVIQLAYGGNNYGDTNSMITIHVYEMMESISNDTVYYSNVVIPVGSTDFANYSFTPRPVDSIVVDGDTIPPALRFSLSDQSPALGEKLLNIPQEDMADNDVFREYFKGLYIVAQPVYSNGTLISFDLNSLYSEMTIFYSNADQDSLRYRYVTRSSATRVNRFGNYFLSGDNAFKQQVVDGDTALGKERFYVQGTGGVRGIIKIGDMKSWREMGVVAINEAKLILSGAEEKPFWGAPPKLLLYEIKEDGKNEYLEDQGMGADYFGGVYLSSTNSYEFRITQYIQSLIDDTTKRNYGLSLYVDSPWYVPNRFIFNGNDTVYREKRLKLNILYTNLSR